MSDQPGVVLAGQVAVVTGAGGGIGSAIAVGLAQRGVAVVLLGRRTAPLARVARRMNPASETTVLATDLTSDAATRAAVRSLLRHHRRLDILVHSNGTHSLGALDTTRLGELDKLWAANVRGPMLLTQLLLPALRAASGQIVFINSSVGLETRPNVGHFAATQHALRALADTLRAEINADGVRVLSVFPGRTASSRQERIYRFEGRSYDGSALLQPEDIASTVIGSLELPRTAEVTDVRIRPLRKT